MKTLVEVLTDSKALIATPETWTQKYLARDVFDLPVPEWSDSAVCFCSLGALSKVCQEISKDGRYPRSYAIARDLLTKTIFSRSVQSIGEFNDTHTHAEVMALWDDVIEQAKQLENK